MDDNTFWQLKLHARLHDPAEKSLVLLRDPAGHEGGTCRALQRFLSRAPLAAEAIGSADSPALHGAVFTQGVPREQYETLRRADWWAAAADRPQWPLEEISVTTRSGVQKTLKVADWAQVNWAKYPVLIHPLTGAEFDLGRHGGLKDTDLKDIKSRSLQHFASLVLRHGDQVDWQRTLLACWRFGPELREEEDFGKLGELWKVLPADTRVPDHSIWDHLDLTSAFAGAFGADPDGEAALLTLSIGPVQPFIAAARSTSDLWAGSHLLARLAWEAMRPLCEELGPDAILFPRLRGVPQVDLWLRDDCGLPPALFTDCDWTRGATDGNPLFTAALPNRFVAVVPRARAEALARQVEERVRSWLLGCGKTVVDRLLTEAGLETPGEAHCHRQLRDQLAGFPEVHWAVVPFSLIRPRNPARQTDLDTTALSAAMAPFFGVEPGQPCGFLASPAWQVLQRETVWADNTTFFSPNPGVLYPAVYDLAERVLAAAKSVRSFDQTEQTGWRCSLTGETEWLTTEPAQLCQSYRRQTDTLWAKIAERQPAWAKKGEHLGALSAIKRLWPTLFAEEVARALGGKGFRRFVVSTHTMALSHQLDRWLHNGACLADGCADALARYDPEPVALPRRLLRDHQGKPALAIARRLAGLLERAADLDEPQEAERLRRLVKDTLLGRSGRLETYYSLLLLDGDRMGAWLSGDGPKGLDPDSGQPPLPGPVAAGGRSYRDGFHPRVRAGFDAHASRQPLLQAYAGAPRALSPNRHLAISGALNDFSLTLVPQVIETEFRGRVIYAGGDDVLAMLPVADLFPAMQRLRWAYSGNDPDQVSGDRTGLVLRDGFALLRGRLMRLMGTAATASAGAVIAHHQAPLGAVLRELRLAESRAKNEGGRDAFCLSLIKRSGGTRQFTAKWGEGEPVALLCALRDFLADPAVSRRAVYNSLEWLKDLPEPDGNGAMLEQLLAYQLTRQSEGKTATNHDVPDLARRLTALALLQPKDRIDWLENALAVAEFLARQGRTAGE
ncbi:type III-B CRISPR-associated protein Cas10/Cmr2 [Candidatus Thiodictyon syntrophicum]|jgi:CRISPR-associated protein Cmr2|uniref:Type III-B CRISPR-associated protein Cas10/Cmr2 n=1 Tax=Candidatus Thiodictyon syntrophicum TaxID=1166950 RepID=A0A2K8U9A3_9GAMM|nr:type III-B CRISPR-associated protein Cas10/Cmr2 [Candidatus Thiodictyon syntrophicum]AUB82166.1 type III-B CRISPR-associated protein Cas10/Cmr2 [Candidatus Thiodictyon syntrophicum]